MQGERFIEEARVRYKAIQSPVNGFNHLIFNGVGNRRTLAEMRHKTLLIPLIVPVIKTAHDASYEKRTIKKNRKKGAPLIVAEFWGLSAKVGKNNTAIRVIVRRVGNGNLTFRSVMRD